MVKKVIRFIVLIIGLSLVAYSGYHLFKIYSDYNTQSFSTFAGNPYFIDLDLLAKAGLLQPEEYESIDWESTCLLYTSLRIMRYCPEFFEHRANRRLYRLHRWRVCLRQRHRRHQPRSFLLVRLPAGVKQVAQNYDNQKPVSYTHLTNTGP